MPIYKFRYTLLLCWLLIIGGGGFPLQAEESLASSYGFAAMEIYKADFNSFAVSVGDFNQDGFPDLASVNNSRARIEFLYSHKGQAASAEKEGAATSEKQDEPNEILDDESFSREYYPVDAKVLDLAAADLNHDGLDDFVYLTEHQTLCLVKQGKKGWQEKQQIRIVNHTPSTNSLLVVDLNQDQAQDMLVLTQDALLVFYQKNQSFAPVPVVLPHIYDKPSRVLVGDLNGDARQDLLFVPSSRKEPVSYRLQEASGAFPAVYTSQLQDLRSIALQHLSQNKAGVFCVQNSSGRIKKYLLEKKSQSVAFSSPLWYPFNNSNERGIALGDITGDGEMDIVATAPGKAEILLYQKKQQESFAQVEVFPSCQGGKQLFFLDSHRLVIFSPVEEMLGIITYDVAKKRLNFPQLIPTQDKIIALDCLDVNGDNLQDLVYIAKDKRSAKVRILYQNQQGFTQGKSLDLDRRMSSANKIRLLDLTQDGKPEVLVSAPYGGLKVYLQQPEGKFQLLESQRDTNILEQVPLEQLALGDVDGDGTREILVAKNNYVRVLKMDNHGKITIVDQYNCRDHDVKATTVLMGSLDADEQPEMILLDQTNQLLVFLSKNSQGLYEQTGRLEMTNFKWQGWQVAHLDNDNVVDIFLAGAKKFALFYSGKKSWEFQEKLSFQREEGQAQYQYFVVENINAQEQDELVINDHSENLLEIIALRPDEMVSALKFRIFGLQEMPNSRSSQQGHQHQVREMVVSDFNQDGKNDLTILIHDRIILYYQD